MTNQGLSEAQLQQIEGDAQVLVKETLAEAAPAVADSMPPEPAAPAEPVEELPLIVAAPVPVPSLDDTSLYIHRELSQCSSTSACWNRRSMSPIRCSSG